MNTHSLALAFTLFILAPALQGHAEAEHRLGSRTLPIRTAVEAQPLELTTPTLSEIPSGWAPIAPTLDAVIGAGEWMNATPLDISLGAEPIILYVLNDADFLYLAFDAQADTSLDMIDYAGIVFDDEGGTPPILGDGTWNTPVCTTTEGIIIIGNLLAGGLIADEIYESISAAEVCSLEVAAGVNGAYSLASGHMVYEMRIDLAVSELHAQPGETFGAFLGVFDWGVLDYVGTTSDPLGDLDPATYLPLTLATPLVGVPSYTTPPLASALQPARPNPFRATTELRFALAQTGPVKIDVFNVNGQHVERLADATMEAGEHIVRWSGLDTGARRVPGGIYYVRMRASGVDETRVVVRIP